MRLGARLALGACVLLPLPSRAQGTPMPRPVAPYVTAACPFECCTYGRWTFVTAAEVRAAPNDGAAAAATIAPGQQVRADSGHVRLTTIGRVLVRRDVRDPAAGIAFASGDTLLVLDYLGEGFTHVWARGRRQQLDLVHVLSLHGPPVGTDTASFVELVAPVSEWWAHVTLSPRVAKEPSRRAAVAPARGWVHMTADVDVRGADACGGPG